MRTIPIKLTIRQTRIVADALREHSSLLHAAWKEANGDGEGDEMISVREDGVQAHELAEQLSKLIAA